MPGLASIINKQSKSKNIGDALIEAIQTSMKVNNPPSRSMRPNIKPSKLQCERQTYYILIQAPSDPIRSTDPKLILMQKIGTFVHLLVQEALAKASSQGVLFRTPEDVVKSAEEHGLNTHPVPSTHETINPYECHSYNEDYDISFMWDGSVYFREQKVLIEIKSEDHFKNIKRTAPDLEHIEQVTCYALSLGIDVAVFLYIDRNYLTMKAYRVEIDEVMKQDVITKISRVKAAVETRTLPEKVICKACKYCDFTKACKAGLNRSREPQPEIQPEDKAEVESEVEPEA